MKPRLPSRTETAADEPGASARAGARRGVAALAALAGIALVIGCGFWRFSYDDAFITYRYARHWAAGEGLVYNRGEAVLGTTAPGYALLLGAISRATGGWLDAPAGGTLLSLAALVAVFALAGRAAARAAPSLSGAALALATGGIALTLRWNVEMLGTETLPILALAVAAAYLAGERERPIAAGLALALAMALRLDAALAAAALGVTLWTARRRFPVAFSLAGLLPLAPWLGWLALRFGAVVPNTLAAKRGEIGRALHGYTEYEWFWLARTLSAPGAVALLVLAAAGAAVAWRAGLHRRTFFRALALWLALHEIAYRILRVPFAPWYEEALVQALVFLAALAALAAAGWAARRLATVSPPGGARAAALALGAALLLPIAAPSVAWLARQWGRPPDPRFAVYARAGRFLAARAPGGARRATVAAVEIGVLGYVSDLRVLDLAGLVSPQVLAVRGTDRLPALVAAARPQFLVDVPAFRAPILGAILARPEVASRYREVGSFTAPDYGGGAVRILERVPSP